MRQFAVLTCLLMAGPFALMASVDRELLALVPPETKAIVSIDAARAQSSTFGQYLLQHMHPFDELTSETGFDPRQDLQHVVIASSGGPGRFVVLARGVFDADRIRTAAKAKGATISKFHRLEIITDKHGDHEAAAVAFPLADVAILGDLVTVHTILENSNVPSTLDAALAAQVAAYGEKNDAWFAALPGTDGLGKGFALGGDQAKTLQSIMQAAGGIHYGETIDVTLEAIARSPQDATSLADVMRLGASMVQMQRQKDPRAAVLAGALDNMELRTTGDRVHLSFSLPEKTLEQLIEQGHARPASLKSNTQ